MRAFCASKKRVDRMQVGGECASRPSTLGLENGEAGHMDHGRTCLGRGQGNNRLCFGLVWPDSNGDLSACSIGQS